MSEISGSVAAAPADDEYELLGDATVASTREV